MEESRHTERARRLESIFDEAVLLDTVSRSAFLKQACRHDTELRQEVESLLQSLERHGDDVRRVFERLSGVAPAQNASARGEWGAPMVDLTGVTVAQFDIIEKLGGGGMGVVYKARDRKLGRLVALKFLPAYLSTDEEAKTRFVNEAQAASALDHPNICTIYDIGETKDEHLYISMAFYEGETLRRKLLQGPLPVDTAAGYARQIALGLAEAHAAGIVHRDIKPANIQITADDRVKILDFGIAKVAGISITRTGTSLGTVAYMSPEQIEGRHVGQRTDLWSLGALLFEMISGERPFTGDIDQAVIYSIRNDPPNELAGMNADVPSWVADLIEQCLEKDPQDRPESAATVADSLEHRRGEVTSARRAVANTTWKWRVAGTTGLVVLLIVAAASLLQLRSGRSVARGLDPNRLAVMPFTVTGDNKLAYLGGGLVELFHQTLSDAGAVKTVDPKALLGTISNEGLNVVSPDNAVQLGGRFGAGRAMMGSLSKVGDQILMTISVYTSDGELETEIPLRATSENELHQLVNEASRQILTVILGASGFDPEQIAAASSDSLEAMKSYLKGTNAFREGALEEARDHFEHAVAVDSGFALAWFNLSGTLLFQIDTQPTPELSRAITRRRRLALTKAWELRDSLPRRTRLVVEGAHLFNYEESIERYRQVLAEYPEDLDALVGISMRIMLHGWYVGHSYRRARPHLAKALRVYPDNFTLAALMEDLLWEVQDYAAADSLANEKRARGVKAHIPDEVLGILREVRDRPVEGAISEGRIDSLPIGTAFWAIHEIYVKIENLDTANELNDGVIESGRFVGSPRYVPFELTQAWLAAGRGQFRKRDSLFEKMEFVQGGYGTTIRPLTYAIPYYPATDSLLRIIDKELVDWDTAAAPMMDDFGGHPHQGEHGSIRSLLRALLALRLGETDRVTDFKSTLAANVDTSDGRDFDYYALGTVQAMEALAEERYEDVLTAITNARPHVGGGWHRSPFRRQVLNRFMMAEALAGLGRIDEALEVYETLLYWRYYGLLYLGPSYLRQAQLYQEIGNIDKAIEYYERLVRLWSECDPELVPMREAARAELNRLHDQRKN